MKVLDGPLNSLFYSDIIVTIYLKIQYYRI